MNLSIRLISFVDNLINVQSAAQIGGTSEKVTFLRETLNRKHGIKCFREKWL